MRHARTQISDEVSRRLLIHMSRPPLQAMPYHGMPCYPLTRKLLVYLGHGFVALFAPLPKSPQTPRGDELSQPAHAMATSVNPKGTERGGGGRGHRRENRGRHTATVVDPWKECYVFRFGFIGPFGTSEGKSGGHNRQLQHRQQGAARPARGKVCV